MESVPLLAHFPDLVSVRLCCDQQLSHLTQKLTLLEPQWLGFFGRSFTGHETVVDPVQLRLGCEQLACRVVKRAHASLWPKENGDQRVDQNAHPSFLSPFHGNLESLL